MAVNGFGITPLGYVRPTFTDLMEQMKSELESEFGNIDFDTNSDFYQFSAVFARRLALSEERLEEVYDSGFASRAEGINLSRVATNIGIARDQPSFATGQVTFTGEDGVIVPLGFQIETVDGIVFDTTQSGTITSGTLTLNVKAEISGASGEVPANKITVITSPLAGLETVNNSVETSGGQNQENDPTLRSRYNDSVAASSDNLTSTIIRAVSTVTDVEDVDVIENDTNATVDGIPPKAFETIVLGGDNTDIANAIYLSKPGNQAFGPTTVNIQNSTGRTVVIGFTRPTEVTAYIRIALTKTAEYPVGGDDIIKADMLDYINNLNRAEDVLLYKLVGVINNTGIIGISGITIETSTDGSNYSESNIVINTREIARTVLANIEVI